MNDETTGENIIQTEDPTTAQSFPVNVLEEKIQVLEAELEKRKDSEAKMRELQIRALADLENYRRRETENRKNWSKIAVAEFVKVLFPNLLELQLGVLHSTDESIKKVVEKFMGNLQKQGLEKIDPEKGTLIDPEKHQVLMIGAGEKGTVVQTLEIGWQYQDMVLSPAKIAGAC